MNPSGDLVQTFSRFFFFLRPFDFFLLASGLLTKGVKVLVGLRLLMKTKA